MKPKFRTILLNKKRIVLQKDFDRSILEGISWGGNVPSTHLELSEYLKDKHPYTVTVLIENLKGEYRNRKEYVKKTKTIRESQYRTLLYGYFFEEFGQIEGNKVFGQWLDKYRPQHEKEKKYEMVDEYIIKYELEPRYREKILKRFRNHEKLFKKRVEIERDRYYNLPEPLNRVDWRNSYDNIFVWEESGKKEARRGGSGASGSREVNSKFIYGLLELNKTQPVPSYLFLYSEENTLLFIKSFDSLCVPHSDIGSNYQIDTEQDEQLKQQGLFLDWDDYSKVQGISATSYDQSIHLAVKRYEEERKKMMRRFKS